MRAINHALTGAIIGLTVSEPLIAVPAALVSHYVLDVIPHYDLGLGGNTWLHKRSFKYLLLIDALLCAVLVLALGLAQPLGWQLAAICAFVAVAPDFASVPRYITVNKGGKWEAAGYMKFANGIQWFQRPIGAVVEIAWLAASVYLLVRLLQN
jgi:hypothetical protein